MSTASSNTIGFAALAARRGFSFALIGVPRTVGVPLDAELTSTAPSGDRAGAADLGVAAAGVRPSRDGFDADPLPTGVRLAASLLRSLRGESAASISKAVARDDARLGANWRDAVCTAAACAIACACPGAADPRHHPAPDPVSEPTRARVVPEAEEWPFRSQRSFSSKSEASLKIK